MTPEKKNQPVFKEFAFEYLELGLSVVPIDPDLKRCTIEDWTRWCDTLPTECEIEGLIKRNPEYQIGLALGKASNIICLDIDITEDNEALAEVRAELLSLLPPLFSGRIGNPAKPIARFFKYNGEPNKKFKYINVDLLTRGSLTVLPPSAHPTCGQYEWAGRPLTEIDLDDLPDMPKEVLDFLIAKNEEIKAKVKNKEIKSSEIFTPEKGRCNHGSHNTLSALAVYLFHRGERFELARNRLITKDQHINGRADYLYFNCPSRGYEWAKRSVEENATIFLNEVYDNHLDEAVANNLAVTVSDNGEFQGDIDSGFTTQWVDDKGRERITRHANRLYDYMRFRFDISYIKNTSQFAVWDGVKFEFKDNEYPKHVAQSYFEPRLSLNEVNVRSGFLDICKSSHRGKKEDYALRDTEQINMLNGVYDIKTGLLVPHNRQFKLSYVVPVAFDKDAICPTWDKLIKLVCNGVEARVKVIEEFIGYCLACADYNTFNKILVLDGGGSNGKSTIIRIVSALLGRENVSAYDITKINQNRFGALALVNKMLNISSEIPKEALSETSVLKQLTGGDPLTVEEKGAGFWHYVNMAKFIITYNKMPYLPDNSDGMRRRLMIVLCEVNFEKTPELKMNKPDKTIIESELPGVFNKCIAAYQGVLKRKAFTVLEESDRRLDELFMASSSILQFINDKLEYTGAADDFVSNEMLWMEYQNFCGGKTSRTKNRFHKDLKIELNRIANCEVGGLKKIKEGEKVFVRRGVSGFKFMIDA